MKNQHQIKNKMLIKKSLACLSLPILLLVNSANAVGEEDLDILELQIEDLLNIQVTSVSKKQESISSVAAAVFVISNDDIRRSGVTNLPDALRMAPGIQVAQIDSNKYAVTARGFNGRFATKLLVMIDGRTVYSPSFSGVYWEMQDIMLEDIERIEIIRGPGGTVWGANAVNGVINIISKHAADTQSTLVSVGAGDYEKGFVSARTGGKISDNGYGRVFIKANQRDEFSRENGSKANDDWESYRMGGRLDYRINNSDSVNVLAEYYQGDINQHVNHVLLSSPYQNILSDEVEFEGYNVLSRWDHSSSVNNSWSLQFFYDHTNREEFILKDKRDTYDIDFTQRIKMGEGHELLWNLSYRLIEDNFMSTPIITVDPESNTSELISGFLQTEFSLIPNELTLTVGSKIEHNDHTGNEVQPSGRLNWIVNPSVQVWSSVAKAVRTPSVAERSFGVLSTVIPPTVATSYIPVTISTQGTDAFASEKLVAYEMGLRVIPTPTMSIDLALFYNDYSDLRSFEYTAPVLVFTPQPYLVSNVLFTNKAEGETKGAELTVGWRPTKKTSFDLAYSYIETDIAWLNVADQSQNTEAPRHQLSLRSAYSVSQDVHVDLWVRYVDSNTVIQISDPIEIDAYVAVDMRLAWDVSPTIELSLVGKNIFDKNHYEYIQEAFIDSSVVGRSFFAKAEFKF